VLLSSVQIVLLATNLPSLEVTNESSNSVYEREVCANKVGIRGVDSRSSSMDPAALKLFLDEFNRRFDD
jgi:hypothetical protein